MIFLFKNIKLNLTLVYLKQIDIFDEFFQFKETLKFNCGENNELISCACLSHDPDSNEEFVFFK